MSLRVKLGASALAVSAAIAAGAIAIDYADSSPGLPVTVRSGTDPHRDPQQVARTVLDQLGAEARIEKMTAIPSDAAIRSEEPNGSRLVPGAQPSGPVWVVRARGSFVGRRTPPGVPDVKSSTGYFVIDDATGEVIEMGTP
jgi:hypothetical protein